MGLEEKSPVCVCVFPRTKAGSDTPDVLWQVLQDESRPGAVAPVGHGAVVEEAEEQHHVARLAWIKKALKGTQKLFVVVKLLPS